MSAKNLRSGKGTAIFDLTVDYGTSLSIGDMFTLVDYEKLAKKFAFSNVADDALFKTGAYTFLIDYNKPIATGDFAIVATLTATAGHMGVPEPRAIFGFGVTALFFMRRRRLAETRTNPRLPL